MQSNVTPKAIAYPPKPPLLASPPVPKHSPTNPVRRQLTQKELEDKRSKNQCFYCDQRYVTGHKCSGQLYALEVVVNDMEGVDIVKDMPIEVMEDEEFVDCSQNMEERPQISLNALSGVNAYKTMRIRGYLGKGFCTV
ncbi:hypothetical protein Tco_0372179 [Tanacetum coccineum]